MKIDLKELGLAYLVGYLVILVTILLNAYIISTGLNSVDALIYLFVIFAIPLSCYFFRNTCDLRTALVVSFIFGLTFLPIYALFNYVYMMFTTPPEWFSQMRIKWGDILLISTAAGVVSGMLVYGLPALMRKFGEKKKK